MYGHCAHLRSLDLCFLYFTVWNNGAPGRRFSMFVLVLFNLQFALHACFEVLFADLLVAGWDRHSL